MNNTTINDRCCSKNLKSLHRWNQSLLWDELTSGEGKNTQKLIQNPITKESIKTNLSAVPNTNPVPEVHEETLSSIVVEVVQENQERKEKISPSVSFPESFKVLLRFLLRILAYAAFLLAVLGVVLCAVFMGSLQQDIETIRTFYIQGGFVVPFLCIPVAFYITVRNWIKIRFS